MRNDKTLAYTYFRICVMRLNKFQMLVKNQLGPKHGTLANITVELMYTQLKKHFMNIMHICSDFRPEQMIKSAKKEVQDAIRIYKNGGRYIDGSAKWNEIRKKTQPST